MYIEKSIILDLNTYERNFFFLKTQKILIAKHATIHAQHFLTDHERFKWTKILIQPLQTDQQIPMSVINIQIFIN